MFYVYILKDQNGKLYIGYTNDLQRRIAEHNRQKVYTSKRMSSPRLIYYEAYLDKDMAFGREKKLKQYGSSLVGLLKRLKLKQNY